MLQRLNTKLSCPYDKLLQQLPVARARLREPTHFVVFPLTMALEFRVLQRFALEQVILARQQAHLPNNRHVDLSALYRQPRRVPVRSGASAPPESLKNVLGAKIQELTRR